MRVESPLSFERVRETFVRENPDPGFGSTDYALRLLEAANIQFGEWYSVVLSLEDSLRVMLPHHVHKGLDLILNLIPESGLLVSEVLPKIELAPKSHECPQRIQKLSQDPLSTIFLSATPLSQGDNSDYRELVRRGYKGLTHLDGLHRLIAYAKSGRSEIVAYVAGLPVTDAVTNTNGGICNHHP
jgi:hypothetical protein